MPNVTGKTSGVRVRGEQRHFRNYLFNGRDRMFSDDGESVTNAGIARHKPIIVKAKLTTNVVTLTTAAAHGLASGACISVNTSDDGATYNGRYVIASVPTTTTLTYAKTASDISETGNGGTILFYVKTAVSGSTGATGKWVYYISPVNKSKAMPLVPYIMGNPSAISDEVNAVGQQVDISHIPATHPDSQVTHWALFRNQTGNYDSFLSDDTQDYWLVDYIPIGTTTYTDLKEDKDLPPTPVRFNRNIPPTCKYGVEFNGRLLHCGYDPITTGTATVNATTTLIDFSGVTLPDGVVGCRFQEDANGEFYEIKERVSSTQVALDRPFVGTLSGASYSIYRDPTTLYYSVLDDFDAWGPDGEDNRNRLLVGGPGAREPITGLATLNGYAYVFTRSSIYRVYGQGVGRAAMKISTVPIVKGIGAVSQDSIWEEGGVLYFLSFLGPMAFTGGSAPVNIGMKIGRDWLDTLSPDQLSITCTGSDGRKVKFAVPESGETENGLIWVYDIETKSWWKEKYIHPKFYFRELDADGKDVLFYAQGKYIFQDEKGTNDGVPSGDVTGTVTTGTSTTSVTCSAATFYSTGNGLDERYAHFYTGDTFVGSRKLTNSTGTTLTWSSTGTGGGNLTVSTGDVVHVGPILWLYRTRNVEIPASMKRSHEIHFSNKLQGEATATELIVKSRANDTELANPTPLTIDQVQKHLTISHRNKNFAIEIESRTTDSDLAIREILVREHGPEGKVL